MVPAMGFGAMVSYYDGAGHCPLPTLGNIYTNAYESYQGLTFHYGNPLPDEDIFAILDRAYELGCTFWDTAEYAIPPAHDLPFYPF